MLKNCVILLLLNFCAKNYAAPSVSNMIYSDIEYRSLQDELPNPDEEGDFLEGDIILSDGEHELVDLFRNGVLLEKYRWPNAVVPFKIEGAFTNLELSVLNSAMEDYHKKTCIRFVPQTKEKDYIAITRKNEGCYSAVGRTGGRQRLNLASRCFRKYGTIIHELMHGLGFTHEQNRYERDDFVRILINNIQPNRLRNFQKASSALYYAFGVEYDFGSVMHYSNKGFSKNGHPTIVPLVETPDTHKMGQRRGFSIGDLDKINAMYDCNYSSLEFK